jgi:hypothetical protein
VSPPLTVIKQEENKDFDNFPAVTSLTAEANQNQFDDFGFDNMEATSTPVTETKPVLDDQFKVTLSD